VKHNLLVDGFYVDVCLPLWQKKSQPREFFIMSCGLVFCENTSVFLALTQNFASNCGDFPATYLQQMVKAFMVYSKPPYSFYFRLMLVLPWLSSYKSEHLQ
jgi:hypothetical protein